MDSSFATGANSANSSAGFKLRLRNAFVDVEDATGERSPRGARSCSPTALRSCMDCELGSFVRTEKEHVANLERKVNEWCSKRRATPGSPPDQDSWSCSLPPERSGTGLAQVEAEEDVEKNAGTPAAAPLAPQQAAGAPAARKQAEEDDEDAAGASTAAPPARQQTQPPAEDGDPPPLPGHPRRRPSSARRLAAGAASFGSIGHPNLCHRACRFFHAGQCTSGQECDYCHEEHSRRAHLDGSNRETLMRMSPAERIQFLATILHCKVELADLGQQAAAAVDAWAAAAGAASTGGADHAWQRAPNNSRMNQLLASITNVKITSAAWILWNLQLQQSGDKDEIATATQELLHSLRALAAQ